jgi:hypothetical protein
MAKEPKTIDAYLKEIVPNASGMTEVVKLSAEILGVAVSTVHRWRAADCVPRADEVVSIVIAVNRNRPNDKKCTLKDVAILCNYKDSYRKKTGD